MDILFVMIPLGAVLIAAAGVLLVWAVRNGQYDELDEMARRGPDDEEG